MDIVVNCSSERTRKKNFFKNQMHSRIAKQYKRKKNTTEWQIDDDNNTKQGRTAHTTKSKTKEERVEALKIHFALASRIDFVAFGK